MKEIFSEVAREHKFILGSFRVRQKPQLWYSNTVENNRFNVEMSDYFDVMPDEGVRTLAENLFKKMNGKIPTVFDQYVLGYLLSDSSCQQNQIRYLRRGRNISRSARGIYRNLQESYDRVMEMGLVRPPPHIFITWTKRPVHTYYWNYDPMARVLTISSYLDNDMLAENFLDCVIYHELLHAELDVAGLDNGHDENFRARMRNFKGYDVAQIQKSLFHLYMNLKKELKHGERITDYQ